MKYIRNTCLFIEFEALMGLLSVYSCHNMKKEYSCMTCKIKNGFFKLEKSVKIVWNIASISKFLSILNYDDLNKKIWSELSSILKQIIIIDKKENQS